MVPSYAPLLALGGIMAGTNYPYVNYLPKKNIKAIQIDTNEENIGARFKINVGILGDSKVAFQIYDLWSRIFIFTQFC